MLNYVKHYKNKKFFILFNAINLMFFRGKFQQNDFETNMMNNPINIRKSLPKKILQTVTMIL